MKCNQSTISRRVQRCVDVFGLRLKRVQGEWVLSNPTRLLQMQRELHQVARLQGQQPLRLEGFPGGASLLLKPPPAGWSIGPLDAVGTLSPLALLRDRVIDAWLTDAGDDLLPLLDFPTVMWPLARQPITLLAHPEHPLAGVPHLSLEDLLHFPMPVIPAEGYPRSHAICADIGLGTVDVPKRRYDPELWEGQTADRATLVFTTPLSALGFPHLVPLDTGPLFTNRLVLVCRTDLSECPRVQDLHGLLLDRLQELLNHQPRLEGLVLIG
ncbi:MAG: hypothetical protein VKP70_03870 [Cyanobacteriota bacterium]|nr:hypothetical protein [Cyanobacteriota bacterium]